MMLLTLYGIPTSLTILKFLIISSFETALLRTFLRNSSLPCSRPNEMREHPTSFSRLNRSYVTVSTRVWHQNGSLISSYISQNSSNSPSFQEKNVSAQK